MLNLLLGLCSVGYHYCYCRNNKFNNIYLVTSYTRGNHFVVAVTINLTTFYLVTSYTRGNNFVVAVTINLTTLYLVTSYTPLRHRNTALTITFTNQRNSQFVVAVTINLTTLYLVTSYTPSPSPLHNPNNKFYNSDKFGKNIVSATVTFTTPMCDQLVTALKSPKNDILILTPELKLYNNLYYSQFLPKFLFRAKNQHRINSKFYNRVRDFASNSKFYNNFQRSIFTGRGRRL